MANRKRYSYEERVKYWTDLLEKGPDACVEYVQSKLRRLEKSQNFRSQIQPELDLKLLALEVAKILKHQE